jgi:hypothetical protein
MMVLLPTTTYEDLFAIVDELNNVKLPAGLSAPRFSGACDPFIRPRSTYDPAATVAWPILGFVVNSDVRIMCQAALLNS